MGVHPAVQGIDPGRLSLDGAPELPTLGLDRFSEAQSLGVDALALGIDALALGVDARAKVKDGSEQESLRGPQEADRGPGHRFHLTTVAPPGDTPRGTMAIRTGRKGLRILCCV